MGSYRVRFRDGTVEGRIHLDSQGRIDGLTFTNSQLTLTGLQPPGAPSGGVAGRAEAVNALLTKRLQRHKFSGSVLLAAKGKVVLAYRPRRKRIAAGRQERLFPDGPRVRGSAGALSRPVPGARWLPLCAELALHSARTSHLRPSMSSRAASR